MSEAKPTPGPWDLWGYANPSQTIAAPTGFVAQTLGGNDEANARLIADAGTVFHTTGHTPSQLVERVKELECVLQAAIDCGMVPKSSASDGGACKYSAQVRVADEIRAAISKARTNTAGGESPAPADSVLEDAARLDWLLGKGRSMAIDSFGGQYRVVDTSCNLVVTDWMPTQRAAIDAARKQAAVKEPSQ